MFKIPFPRMPRSDGGVIGKIAKAIWNAITQKPSQEIGEIKQQNKNSSVEDIDKIQSIFDDYRGQVHREASKIESGVYDEVAYYVEELNDILVQNEQLLNKYKIRTKHIEKAVKRLSNGIKGNIDRMICKKVSLDNLECRNILQMMPGTKKEQAMSDFLRISLKEALNQYCEDFKQTLLDLFDEVEEEIVQAIEKSGEEAERQCLILENVNEDNYVERNETIVSDAQVILNVCDMIIDSMEVK